MKAEKPERARGGADGIRNDSGVERQAAAASGEGIDEQLSTGSPVTMEEVLDRRDVEKALRRVKSNKGAPGVDGMTVWDLEAHVLSPEWERARERLGDGSYRPKAVRGAEIRKPHGGTRMLGIPTVRDRLVQQMILQKLQPIIDLTFSESSFGYRPGRSALDAVERWKEYVEDGREWVVNIDLRAFFDRIHHDKLMHLLGRHVNDKRILKVTGRYLRADLMEGGLSSQRRKGAPQGGPLSPLLSNIYLHELDRELEQRGHRFVRYADDFIVLVKSEKAGRRVLESVRRFLDRKLKLEINEDKSSVERVEEISYLGYCITFKGGDGGPRLAVSRKSHLRIRAKLREELSRKARGRSIDDTIKRISPVLRGLYGYIRLAETQNSYRAIDGYVRRRLRMLIWRHWKTPKNRCKKLVLLGLAPAKARQYASTSKGPWRISGTPFLQQALSNDYFVKLGLFSLEAAYQRGPRPRQLSLRFS